MEKKPHELIPLPNVELEKETTEKMFKKLESMDGYSEFEKLILIYMALYIYEDSKK